MAGIWLENGLHLQIKNSLTKELAEEIHKNGSADFMGSKVQMVLPNSSTPEPKPTGNTKEALKRLGSRFSSSDPKMEPK